MYSHDFVAADATETNCALIIAENLPLKESLSVGRENHVKATLFHVESRHVLTGGSNQFLTYSYPFPVVIYRFVV